MLPKLICVVPVASISVIIWHLNKRICECSLREEFDIHPGGGFKISVNVHLSHEKFSKHRSEGRRFRWFRLCTCREVFPESTIHVQYEFCSLHAPSAFNDSNSCTKKEQVGKIATSSAERKIRRRSAIIISQANSKLHLANHHLVVFRKGCQRKVRLLFEVLKCWINF